MICRGCWFGLCVVLLAGFFVPFVHADEPIARVESRVYKTTPQAELSLAIHFPRGWTANDKRPLIVFFFGGGWTNGTIKQFEPQAEYLATRGMVAARADYRVKSRHQVAPDQCVEDAKSAIRWCRGHARELGIDPDKIIASGGSAGGHIAACTSLTPGLDAKGEDLGVSSRPNALVLFNPVLCFDGVPQLMERIGGRESLGKAISPTLHLTAESPPTLLFYGTEDKLLIQGQRHVEKGKSVGCRVELETTPGQGHSFFNRSPHRERTLKQADEFLRSLGYLDGPPTITIP